jgi:hypothetical protein
MRTTTVIFCASLLLLGTGPGGPSPAVAQGPYQLQTSVIGAAGYPGSGSGKATNGTLGQSTPIGIGSRANRILYAGFWYYRHYVLSDIPETTPLVNELYGNYPNPFNPATTIRFSVAEQSPVSLKIYDIAGRRVATLVQESLPPGQHSAVWRGRSDSGRPLASGLYLYRLEIGNYMSVKKMLLLK